ncbi:msf membrane transporter [Grosmannia clavigera kw1407]|uniref:Msf membrane transporter n=1 Tax=Grosmannia clavigera (strain kw1407 / UAMH 11150) TaxID=655863 RepID=F0XJC1_GROCL|nr:msf membrane transporter [Grosmannia clavigera kw1407]EFX02153.1 msf membrane transporter [Grosmannia clavigera kw1407]
MSLSPGSTVRVGTMQDAAEKDKVVTTDDVVHSNDSTDIEADGGKEAAGAAEDVAEMTVGAGELSRRRSRADMDPAFEVRFAAGDVEDPHNRSPATKAGLTLLLGGLAFAGSLGSSIVAPAQAAIAAEMAISREVTVLLMSLFLLGFAVGPMVWAPVSEAYGRRWSMLPALMVLGLFSIGSARSRTPAALLATRLLGGVFGSAPVSNVTAALGDLFAPRQRGVAMAFYSLCVVGGPFLAPVIGAAVVADPRLGWRWTLYLEAIVAFSVTLAAFVLLPETYAPVLLARRAARLRALPPADGGDSRFWHPHDLKPVTLRNVVSKHLSRPLRMLFTEPIVSCVAAYASFVYALIFLVLEVYPIVFREQRCYGPVVAYLPYLGLFVGALSAVVINLANQPLYLRAVDRNNGRAVPEARLPPIFVGGCLLPAGLFWFAWTAKPSVPWPVPTVAGGFIAAGFNIIFQQCLNYLIDCYGRYAASATSANTILRSLLACCLPLAARPMFINMGVGPTASLLGGISCVALPLPFLLMRYGARLRAMSKFVD